MKRESGRHSGAREKRISGACTTLCEMGKRWEFIFVKNETSARVGLFNVFKLGEGS